MERPSPWLLAVLTVLTVTIAVAILIFIPIWLHPSLSKAELQGIPSLQERIVLQQAQGSLQDETRATLLQAFGGLILVGGAFATWRQVQVSRHGQITERITRAVEQLAGPSMDVRIGGIYALQRVARNSVEDRQAVTGILAAFVRTRSPWKSTWPSSHDHEPLEAQAGPPWTGTTAGDVQIALYVLASRPRYGEANPPFLSFADLSNARMANRDWTGLVCQYANLTGAWMHHARLEGASLSGTDLRQAQLEGASLVGAKLDGAHLRGANLRYADLQSADLTGTCLEGADLTGVRANVETKWPADFAPPEAPVPDIDA
jgi:Pentapeptide repeats (8 copies)